MNKTALITRFESLLWLSESEKITLSIPSGRLAARTCLLSLWSVRKLPSSLENQTRNHRKPRTCCSVFFFHSCFQGLKEVSFFYFCMLGRKKEKHICVGRESNPGQQLNSLSLSLSLIRQRTTIFGHPLQWSTLQLNYKKHCQQCSVVQTRANDDNLTFFNATHESPQLVAGTQHRLHPGYNSFYCASPKGL